MSRRPRIAVLPAGARTEAIAAAVAEGGGELSPITEAEALVWADPTRPDALGPVLAEAGRQLRWVSLPFTGIEPYVKLLDRDRIWTCARGVYATPVAEHVLALGLAGMRGLGSYARASTWERPIGRNLIGARVTILGGGGIARELIRLLEPFSCAIWVLKRHPEPIRGTERVVGADLLVESLERADLVVVALSLTSETDGLIGAAELAAMPGHAWIVNVGRGPHIRTDDLVSALGREEIGGAALDVTDPEPLPDGHPLWDLENAIITPHIANTPEMGLPLLTAHVEDNVRRWVAGEKLLGVVDVDLEY